MATTTTTTTYLSRAQTAARAFLRRTRESAPMEAQTYVALPYRMATGHGRHAVFNRSTGYAVDTYGSESAARHAAHLLNTGAATVYPHETRGCRVQPMREPSRAAVAALETDFSRHGSAPGAHI